MTYPITPDPSILTQTPGELAQEAEQTLQSIEALGQQLIQAVVNALLSLLTGGLAGNTAGTLSSDAMTLFSNLFANLFSLFGSGGSILSALIGDIESFNPISFLAQFLAPAVQAVAPDASSFGSVTTGSPTSLTVAHACAATPNTGLVVYTEIIPLTPETYTGGTTVTYNGVATPSAGTPVNLGDGTGGWLECFTLTAAAGGQNNVVITPPSAVQSIIASAQSYTGCSGFSSYVSAATDAVSQGITVQTVANGMGSFAFASAAAINDVPVGVTTRTLQNTSAGNLIVGDVPGGAAVTATAMTQTGVTHVPEGAVLDVTAAGTTTDILGLRPTAAETIAPSVVTTDVVAISGTGAGTIPVTPAGAGGLAVPPLFDATAISSASGAQTNTLALSWSHTVGTGSDNCGIIAVIGDNNGIGGFVPTGTPTASIGGTPLTYLGSVLLGNASINGFIAVWAVQNVPTGSQTAAISMTDTGQGLANAYGTSFTYTGVTGIGSLQTAFNTNGTTQSALSVPSAVDHLVWGLLANYQTGTYTSPTFTSHESQTASAPYFDAGDIAGASLVSVGATQSTTYAGAVVGLDLT